MKEITAELRKRLRQIGEEEKSKRRRTIFVDKPDTNKIYYPWKKLSNEYKLKLVTNYIQEKNLDINVEFINQFKLLNIEYEKNKEIIHYMEFEKK